MTKIFKSIFLCGVILTLLPGRGFAAAPIPATPAGVALGTWLTAFNSGDAKLWKSFYDSYSLDHKIEIEALQKMQSIYGEFTLLRVTVDEKFRIEALLKDKNEGRRWRIAIKLNENKPSSIESIWLGTGSPK